MPIDLLDKLNSEIKVCQLCRLSKSRTNAVPGEGNKQAEIVLLGEAPGATEDKKGKPFVGRAGKLLDKLLNENGIKRSEAYITNIVKCRPPKNRKPMADEINACSWYLESQIELIKPKLIVTLGVTPLTAMTGMKTIGSLHGSLIKRGKRMIFPTYHPAAALRAEQILKLLEKDFAKIPRALDTARKAALEVAEVTEPM